MNQRFSTNQVAVWVLTVVFANGGRPHGVIAMKRGLPTLLVLPFGAYSSMPCVIAMLDSDVARDPRESRIICESRSFRIASTSVLHSAVLFLCIFILFQGAIQG